MRILDFNEIGAHRGAREIESAIPRSQRVGRVRVVDPLPGRARDLGKRYASRGAAVEVDEARFADVEHALDPDLPTILTIDDTRAMALAGRGRANTMLAQGVFQAPVRDDDLDFGGATAGVSLPILRARPEEALLTQEVLDTLADASPPQSSAVFRRHALDGARLGHVREETSRGTVLDLLEPDRLERERLASLFAFHEQYPLVLARAVDNAGNRAVAQARDIANGASLAVALVRLHEIVEFFLFGPGGRLKMHVPFRVPPKVIDVEATAPEPVATPAFTD